MLRRRLPLWLVGGAALLLPLLTWSLPSSPVRASLREWSLDLLLPWLPTRQGIGPEIAIVDLDGAALDRFGPWPWPRARLAQVVGAVAKTAPAVIAIDILLEGRDRFSAEAWLDLAPDPMQRARLAAAVADFPDGDAQLGDALSAAASALGFVLDPSGPGTPLPVTPVLLSTPLVIPDAWRANSVIGPEPRLAAGAQGFGGLVMAADFDGRIRRVPLLVVAGR
ncbi:MAG: CHASE2 domain-containing protein, partial [Acetobacteraceae bacterium]|nr:CHASE2 domain-containing protein [Acetobacteraceae bacterium]